MVKKIEMRGILRDGDVIEVWEEGEISIGDNNLSAPDNLPVTEAAAQSIVNDEFFHNGLCHRRME